MSAPNLAAHSRSHPPTPPRIEHRPPQHPHEFVLLPTSGPHAFAIAAQLSDEVTGVNRHGIAATRSRAPSMAQLSESGSAATSTAITIGTTEGSGTGLTGSAAAASRKLIASDEKLSVRPEPPPLIDAFKSARRSILDIERLPRRQQSFYKSQNELIDFYLGVERTRARLEAERERELERERERADAQNTAAESVGAAAPSLTAVRLQLDTASGSEPATARRSSLSIAAADQYLEEDEATRAANHRTQRAIAFAINVSFVANIFLLAIKAYAATTSSSLAVIASTVDSVLDLLSGAAEYGLGGSS